MSVSLMPNLFPKQGIGGRSPELKVSFYPEALQALCRHSGLNLGAAGIQRTSDSGEQKHSPTLAPYYNHTQRNAIGAILGLYHFTI